MKKAISLLLSVIMVLSSLLCVNISAIANDYEAISVGETKTAVIQNGGDYCYFSFTPEEDGKYEFSSNSSSDTYGYLYDAEMNELAYDDDGGTGNNFRITYDFSAGVTYIFGCRYYSSDNIGSFYVSLIVSDVASISFTPAEPYQIIEFTNGYWYDEHFEYNLPEFANGDVLSVTDKDGNTKDYVFDWNWEQFISDDGDSISLGEIIKNSNQYLEHWILCGEYSFMLEYCGATCSVPVFIIENPVASISFTPAASYEIIENTYGYAETDDDGESYYRYSIPEFKNGDTLSVTDKDGNTTDYVFDYDEGEFISEDGDIIYTDDIDRYSNQDSEHWVVDGENYFTVSCLGKTVSVSVAIVETPVESLEFTLIKPFNIIENTMCYEGEDGEIFYDTPDFRTGDKVTITFKDESVEEYTFNSKKWGWYDSEGNEMSYYYDHYSYQYQEPWTLGSDNYFIVNIHGATAQIPVTISESPVSSIAYEPSAPIVSAEGVTYARADGDGTFTFGDGYAHPEDKLTIYYKNGQSEEYFASFDNQGILSFSTADGKLLDEEAGFRVGLVHNEENWRVIDAITIYCYGENVTLPVTDSLTIASATFRPVKPVSIVEYNGDSSLNDIDMASIDDDGNVYYYLCVFWDDDENGDVLLKSNIFHYGDALDITFSDGSSKTYTYYENRSYEFGYGFIAEDGTVLYFGDFSSNQDESPWSVGGDNYFTIDFDNTSTERIPVTIVSGYDTSVLNSVISVFNSLDESDYSFNSFSALETAVQNSFVLIQNAGSQEEIDLAVTEILEAFYGLQPYINLGIEAKNGSVDVSYGGESYDDTTYSLMFGTQVTLLATAQSGYVFDGWYESTSSRLLSTETTYSFKITSNTNIEARFVKTQSATLFFKNDSGWIADKVTKTVAEWNKITSIESLLPDVPYKLGYENGVWSYDNTDVLNALRSGENVVILPQYDETDYENPVAPEPEGDEPVLELYYQYDADKRVGSFIMAAGIPDGCEIESIGITLYYDKAANFNPSDFILNLNNKLTTSKFNVEDKDSIYIVDINNMSSNYNWAVKGYVTYYDNGGNLKIAYTNQINIVDRQEV